MIDGSSRAAVGLRLAAAVLTAALSLLAAEIAFRFIDGYTLSPRLAIAANKKQPTAPSPNRKWLDASDAEYYVARLPTAPDMDRAWFRIDPPALPNRPIDAGLLRRYDAHPGFELSSVYEWNAE